MPEPERSPTSRTQFAGLIGDPVAHSSSPLLHNAAAVAAGLDLVYGAFLVRAGDVAAAIEGARALGFAGLSVTMPHKAAAAAACWQRSDEVEALGVANTVVFRAGVAVGYNTDGAGFIEDLERNCGLELASTTLGIFGTGGAARAIAHASRLAGATVVVVGRDLGRATEVAQLGGGRTGDLVAFGSCGVVVNATPIGMLGTPAGKDAEVVETLAAVLAPQTLLVDIVTTTPTTPLMAAAQRRGIRVRNGIGMLVHQAAAQFELFTGVGGSADAMWHAVAERS